MNGWRSFGPALGAISALSVLLYSWPALAAERLAEVVQLEGRGETRSETARDWQPAPVGTGLGGGDFVRTGDASRMGLLFVDQTQLKLAPNSQLQVKPQAAGGERVVDLQRGRTWANARKPPGGLVMTTPSATAAIRGTEWSLEVDADGRAVLTVLSGEVRFFNPEGEVQVASGEEAEARVGQAPVKRRLAQPGDRVQWTTRLTAAPLRLLDAAAQAGPAGEIARAIEAGTLAEAERRLAVARHALSDAQRALLMAELAVARGDFASAEAELAALHTPLAVARLGELLLAGGKVEAARDKVDAALAIHPQDAALLRVRAEIARRDGAGREAEALYGRAIAAAPEDERGWAGRARVRMEREDLYGAQADLDAAIERRPDDQGLQAQAATLAMLAQHPRLAEQGFARALSQDPADYEALTSQGLWLLQQGQPQAALASLLRASTIEPRYARALSYSGAAYYQLGDAERALAELRRAATLDERDPLPWIFMSLIHTDRFEAGEAVAASRAAAERMPYARSLNQLANDQRGSANAGQALAAFGLEDWAQSLAQQSYSPYWAASHLFLADRYPEGFNKTSELFQGLLADPLVFGASNREQTLIARPGHYGSVGGGLALFERNTYGLRRAIGPGLQFSGRSAGEMPVAYFAQLNGYRMGEGDEATRLGGDYEQAVGAFGIRPSHDLGLFAYTEGNRTRAALQMMNYAADTPVRGEDVRLVLGAHYRPHPDRQLWLRAGLGRSRYSWERFPAATIFGESLFDRIDLSPDGDNSDFGLRQTLTLAEHELGFGLEAARQDMRQFFEVTSSQTGYGPLPVLDLKQRFTDRDLMLWAGDRWQAGEGLTLEALLHAQRHLAHQQAEGYIRVPEGYLGSTEPGVWPYSGYGNRLSRDRLNPRLGLAWKAADTLTARLAAQRWMRPASAGTLAPVAIAGVPLDDRLVTPGGLLDQYTARLEWTATPRDFALLQFESKRVRNLVIDDSLISVPTLGGLSQIRPPQRYNLAVDGWNESAPSFGQGRLRTLTLAWNHLLSERWSVFSRYMNQHSANLAERYDGLELPYAPRHTFGVGATHVTPLRINLSAIAVWHSARFHDEANLSPLVAGWNFAALGQWESRDKRWAVVGLMGNIRAKNWPSLYQLDVRYRF